MAVPTTQFGHDDGYDLRSQTLRSLNHSFANNLEDGTPHATGTEGATSGVRASTPTWDVMQTPPLIWEAGVMGMVTDVRNWNEIPLPLPAKVHHVFLRPDRLTTTFLIVGVAALVVLLLQRATRSPTTGRPGGETGGSQERLLLAILADLAEIKRCCHDMGPGRAQ